MIAEPFTALFGAYVLVAQKDIKIINFKRMKPNEAITQLIAHKNSGNDMAFYATAETYIQTLNTGGTQYRNIAYHIREYHKKPKEFKQLKPLPVEINKLVSESSPHVENMFLNQQTKELLEQLIVEWSHRSIFAEHNLKARNRILLHGPTGNGKTTFAKYVAKEAGLPFIQINNEGMIDSHMGVTGRNIDAVFEKIDRPCVMFWDEFDSVACERAGGGGGISGEENRIVNSLLVHLEKIKSGVVFMAATNMFENIDPAIARRFDVKHEMSIPEMQDKIRYANDLGMYYKIPLQYLPKVAEFEYLNSFAEIEGLMKGAARAVVMDKISKIKEKELVL